MRNERDFKVTDKGRDKDRVYKLTEMPASKAEKWAARAFLALAKSGVDLPDDFSAAGVAGLAVLGFRALSQIDYEDLEPLLDEMMTCVQIKPDPAKPTYSRDLVENDIEEVATRIKLRAEVFELHTGFIEAAAQQKRAVASTK